MIEGRSGGSGRGTRRELWAPPDSGSSTSGSYVVSCTDARPSPPTHFPPPLPHPRTCLLRSGGSGRGTRRASWAPPDSGSSTRGSYVVWCTDARPSPPTHFPPPLPHPRTCLLATGKNSAAPERTFSSLVSAEWRAQRENERREERGIWAGHSKRIVGPT